MSRIRLALAGAALAGGALATAADATSVVCVNEPLTNPVYRGCTYVDTTRPCVYGGGYVAGNPYILVCHL